MYAFTCILILFVAEVPSGQHSEIATEFSL